MQEITELIHKKCAKHNKNYKQKCVKDTNKQVFNIPNYQSKMIEQLINTFYKK